MRGYSADLIREVRELYPDSPKMIELAQEGSAWLGRYLDDSCPSGIPINDVLLATSLDELQKKARLYKRKIDLYKKWCEQDPRKQ